MSELSDLVLSAFSVDGPLVRGVPGFTPRPVQTEMALGVARAIDDATALVVEAGTGIGKTFGYLVPTLLSGRRALISTATKSLQDQLFHRDLPTLASTLAIPATAALLKGRGSYLCPHRLKLARQDALLSDRQAVRLLSRIEHWAPSTATGDLSELAGLEERSSVLPLVTSTRDNCLGADCPELSSCHVIRARRAAMAADLVVVNHHLFFADLMVRETGLAELLPTVDVVVLDEAHQLVSTGVQFMGTILSSAGVADLGRDIASTGLQLARGLAPWPLLGQELERAARSLREACQVGRGPSAVSGLRLRWDEVAKAGGFQAALSTLEGVLNQAEDALGLVAEAAPDFVRLKQRATEFRSRLELFRQATSTRRVRWVDVSPHHVRLLDSPLDIRDSFSERVSAAGKTWVFTSATLGDREDLAWFVKPAGLDAAAVLRLPSPFDYPRQARLLIPRRMPLPNDPSHPAAVAALASRLAEALGGRTFVLTTTLRALRSISGALEGAFQARSDDGSPPMRVLVQGQSSKRLLLQEFLAHPRSVLVGSQSFWEGIDVPGDALQCVIIDKLPFPPPGDPLIEARAEAVRARGGDAFGECFVSEAAVALKQGAGRLIRSPHDQGLLVVCDPRLHQQRYGARLIAALPDATRVDDEEAAVDYLRWLTTGATSASLESVYRPTDRRSEGSSA